MRNSPCDPEVSENSAHSPVNQRRHQQPSCRSFQVQSQSLDKARRPAGGCRARSEEERAGHKKRCITNFDQKQRQSRGRHGKDLVFSWGWRELLEDSGQTESSPMRPRSKSQRFRGHVVRHPLSQAVGPGRSMVRRRPRQHCCQDPQHCAAVAAVPSTEASTTHQTPLRQVRCARCQKLHSYMPPSRIRKYLFHDRIQRGVRDFTKPSLRQHRGSL